LNRCARCPAPGWYGDEVTGLVVLRPGPRGGLTLPAPVALLALDLERRGFRLATEGDCTIVVRPSAGLTADDCAAIRQWKAHLVAWLAYEPPIGDASDTLGHPLQANNLGQREYASLIKAAKVRTITFHGLRHTCATLLLQAGTPVHVVSERLGHAQVSMTMEVYAHVLPDMQQQAATTLGALLHG